MPESSKSAPKRRATAFKPPRPATKISTTPRRKSAPAKTAILSSSLSEDELQSSAAQESPVASAPSGTQDPPPTIPPKLLTRILHHHFKESDVGIGKDANDLVGKYMETFVREAIARATYERSEADGGGLGGEFLEVSGQLGRSLCIQKVDMVTIGRGPGEASASAHLGFLSCSR